MKEKVEYGLLQKLFGSGKKQETGRSFESGRSHWTGMKCLETEREGEDKTRKLDTKPWQPCPKRTGRTRHGESLTLVLNYEHGSLLGLTRHRAFGTMTWTGLPAPDFGSPVGKRAASGRADHWPDGYPNGEMGRLRADSWDHREDGRQRFTRRAQWRTRTGRRR